MACGAREGDRVSGVRIDGATRLYAILGDPIAQVKSPALFTERFARAGLNAVMVPMHVLPDRFDAAMQALMALGNLDGLVLTVPYKARGAAYATRLGRTASAIGAVNALRRERDGTWTGDMFDGLGFVRGAERKGYALAGRRVALYGAGGAGSAIGAELVAAGAASLAIVDPARGRARTLASRLTEAFPGVPIAAAEALPPGTTMIVNASTIGLRDGEGLPGDFGPLDGRTLIGDVMNTDADAPSPMIRHARAHGCPYVTGREMFEGQADALAAFLRKD
jgi:shikimate dehydrogenase